MDLIELEMKDIGEDVRKGILGDRVSKNELRAGYGIEIFVGHHLDELLGSDRSAIWKGDA